MTEPARPPKPEPLACVVCGEKSDWVWDDDIDASDPPEFVPQPEWVIDSEWWGKAFHDSRRCYVKGAEYRARMEREQSA